MNARTLWQDAKPPRWHLCTRWCINHGTAQLRHQKLVVVVGGCNMASLWTDTMDNRHKWLSQMACMILSPRNQR